MSVCTPAYYADVVCERARCYLNDAFKTPSQSMAGGVGVEPAAMAGGGVLVYNGWYGEDTAQI